MTNIHLIRIANLTATPFLLPVFSSLVPAGFPSPASDELAGVIDLNRLLLRHPDATYLLRVSGESMSGAEIHAGDLLAVDKHLEADHNMIVVAVVEGECTVKRLVRKDETWWLMPENPAYRPFKISDNAEDLRIWGVVTHVVHELIPGKLTALLRSRD
jgi:DNA polymerase V